MGDEDDQNAIACKVVLIGASGVGKTSIISRYVNDTFNSKMVATIGASFTTKTLILEKENQSVKFEIWDTAGQEKYKSMAKVFYRNAAACIFVYDITLKRSFEDLKNFWVNEIKQNASPNIITAIAGNKSDMYQYEEVSAEEGKSLAKEINAIYKTTSAKMSKGIDDLFRSIAKKVVNPDSEDLSNLTKEEQEQRKRQMKIKEIQNSKKNDKKCC